MVHGQDKARNSEELGTTMEISIVCTNFNKGQWIRETIEGFLMQEFSKDFEIILVDDCSTDISKEIIDLVDFAVEEDREKVSQYSGSSVIKIWSDNRIKVLRE